jgi:hypothetical protein
MTEITKPTETSWSGILEMLQAHVSQQAVQTS